LSHTKKDERRIFVMKKFWIIILCLAVIAGIAFFFFRFLQPNTSNPSIPYTAERTQADLDSNFNHMQTQIVANYTTSNASTDLAAQVKEENEPESQVNSEVEPEPNPSPTEPVEVSSFSTPLKSKANGRRNNIEITASTLEGHVIEPGQTFSFNKVVGKPTSARGYQKADVLVDGETIQAIGGGNCQVSTTVYNAALEVPDFEILERHDHSKKVPYIAKGKDAAVSYGSLDLKFKNNGSQAYKLSVNVSDSEITATFYSI